MSDQQPPKLQQQIKEAAGEYYDPTTQQYQYKIFINHCNDYIGSQLVEAFRNDDQIEVNPNLLIGTLNGNIKYSGDLSACSIIDIEHKRLLNSVLKKSDLILFALNKGNAQEFQYLVKLLGKIKQEGQERRKKLICISSLLTWNGKRGNLDLKPALDDLYRRNSTEGYLLELQNLCLALNSISNGVESYVVCAGLIYGNGQDQLFSYFKRALEQSESLKIYGKGTNYIPMIHLEDLCQMVKDIAFTGFVGSDKREKMSLPESHYYFAVDSAKITQKELISNIAGTLGNGAVEEWPVENAFLKANFDEMTIDLKVEDIPSLVNWHSYEGIMNNMGKVVSQFNLYRGLKPNKIIIIGPPASGKSKVAQLLADAYGLPVLKIKKVVEEIQLEEDEYAQNIKIKIEEIRTQKIEEERKAFEQAKKKKKGKKDAADEFDASKVVARLPDEDIVQIYKRRLNKSDCLNKGYILDGWPRTSKNCKSLFLNEHSEIIENIFPNCCFQIIANEEEVKERIKNLPVQTKETTHWNEEATIRRFQAYIKSAEDGLPKQFFKDKVDIKDVAFNYDGAKEFVQFVERNGPLGFKKKQNSKENQGQVEGTEKIEAEAEIKNNEGNLDGNMDGEDDQENQGEELVEQNNEEQPGEFDLQKLTEHQKQILNQKSRPIRQYLIDNVIPQITEGLLEICKQTPQDPIGFLIRFLENKEMAKSQK